jgi:hypothetical protein
MLSDGMRSISSATKDEKKRGTSIRQFQVELGDRNVRKDYTQMNALSTLYQGCRRS